jgi:hypothetical protein
VSALLVVPDNVAEVSFTDVTDPDPGPVYRAIWAVAPGAEVSVVDRVAELTEMDADVIAADVDRFVAELLAKGFLDRRGD